MSKTSWGLFFFTTLAALIAPAGAWAQNKRVCVEVLSRPTSRAVAPLAVTPAATPAASASTPPAEAPAAVATAPVTAAAATEARCSGVVTACSDADVLPPEAADARVRSGLPLGQRPLGYLKRLMEYFISHEKGFVAVPGNCEETVHVELYPLVDGWTVFVRYTGTGREERVDRLLPSELSQFAERAATALLYGKPISATINRENVLVSDSKEYAQRLRGTHHFIMGVGTQLRVGRFAGAVNDPTSAHNGDAVDQYRFFSPVSFFMGYRGRFESWGLETNVLAAVGTTQTALKTNPKGGHIDLEADGGLQLHFLHYFDPRGLMSFYLGGGSTFELLWFQAIQPTGKQQNGGRSNLLGGGLDVDLVLGWEFMRASTAQFFLQGELQMPTYVLSNENDNGALHSWFPAVGIKLGVLF
jgi:hypothetical protein